MLATLFYDEVEADPILCIPNSLEKKSLCEKTVLFSRSPVAPVEGERESGTRWDLNASHSASSLFPSIYPSSVLYGSLSFPELEASVLWWVSPRHSTTIYLLGVNNCKAAGAAHRSDCCLLPIELPIAHNQSLLTCGITRQGSGRHCVTVVWVTTSLEVGMVGLVIQREQGGGRHHTFTPSSKSPTSLSPSFLSPKNSAVSGNGGVGNLTEGYSSTVTVHTTGPPLGTPLESVGGVSSWKSGSAPVSTGGYGKLCLQLDDNRCVSGVSLSEVRDAFASEAEQEPRNSYVTRQSPLVIGIPDVQMLSACVLSDVPSSIFQEEGKRGSKKEICAVILVTNGRCIWRVFLHPNGTVSHHAFVDNKRVSHKLDRAIALSQSLPEKEGLFRFLSDRDLMELSNLQEWEAVQELAQRKHGSLSSSWASRLHDGESSETGVQGERKGTVYSSSSSTVSSRWWSAFFSGKSRCHMEGTTTPVTSLLPARRYLCISAVQESPGWFALLRWDGLLEFYDGLSDDIAPLWFHFPTCRVPHVSDAARLGELGSFSRPTTATTDEKSTFVSFSQWAKYTPSTQKIDVVTIATSMRRSCERARSAMESVGGNGWKDQEFFKRRGRLGGKEDASSSFSSPSVSYRVMPHRNEKVEDEEDGEIVVDAQLVFWTSAPTNLPYSAEERIALRNSVVLTPPFPGGVLFGCSTSCCTSSGDADVTTSTVSSTTTTHPTGLPRTEGANTLVSRLNVLWAGSAASDFLSLEEEGKDRVESPIPMMTGVGGTLHALYSSSDSSGAIRGKHNVPRCSIASMLQSGTSCNCGVAVRSRKETCHCHSFLQTVDAVERLREGEDENTNDGRRSEKGHWTRVERSNNGHHGSLSSLGVGLSRESGSGASSSEEVGTERGGERRVCGDHIYRVEGGRVSAILTLEESTTVAVEAYLDYHRLHVVEDGAQSGVESASFRRSPLDDLLERTTLPLPLKEFRHRFRGRESNESTEEEEEEEEDNEESRRWEERRSYSGGEASYYFPSKGFRSLHLTPCDGREEGIQWKVAKRWLQEQISDAPSSDAHDLSISRFHSFEDEAERSAMAVFSVIVDAFEHHSDGASVLLQLLRGILDREPSSLQTVGALPSTLGSFFHGSELPLDPYGAKYCLTPSRVLDALHYALRYDLRLAVSCCSFSSAPVSYSHFSRYYIASSISRQLLHRLVFVACLYLGWTSRTSQQEVADEDENFCAAPSTDRVSVQLRLALEYLSAAFFTVQAAGADVANFGALMAPRLLAASGASPSSSVADTEAGGGSLSSSFPLPPFATVGSRPRQNALLGSLYKDAVLFSFLSPDIVRESSTCLIERCVSIGWGFYKGCSHSGSSSSRSGQTFTSRGGVQAALVWAMHMGARVPLLQHFLVLQDLEAGRTRRTNESLIPRCKEMMMALSSFPSPLSSSPLVFSPTSLSFPSESPSDTMLTGVLLGLGFLLTDPTASTYFSLMRVEALRFLLERHPEMGSTWYAVGLLRRVVGAKGSGILLATTASVDTFFLAELRKLRQFVEEEIQFFASASGTAGVSGSHRSAVTPSFTGGSRVSSTMWSSVWGGLFELHIDTLLALAYAAMQEGDVLLAFHHLDTTYRMITNPPAITSVGEKSATTTSTTGTAGATTMTTLVADGVESAGCGAGTRTGIDENEASGSCGVASVIMGNTPATTIQSHPHYGNDSVHPFLESFLSPLSRIFTLLVRRVCFTPTDVLLLSEMPSLSPLLEEWMVVEWTKSIVEMGENESRMHSLREASVYALHRFFLHRHAYGECGRMMSDLASILRGSTCVVEPPLRMCFVARLTALALNAVEMIRTGTTVPTEVAVYPFTSKKQTPTDVAAADGRHKENRSTIFSTPSSAVGCGSHTIDAVPRTYTAPFSSPSFTLSARALSRKDLPWLRLRVYVAHCESLLRCFLSCETPGKVKEEEDGGNRFRHAHFSESLPHSHPMTGRKRREASTLPPEGSTAVSFTTAEKWMDLWREEVPVKLMYTAAAELVCTLGAHQHWREAFRFTVLFRAMMKKQRRRRGAALEDPLLPSSPAFSFLEESVDPCRVLECWAASLATRSDPYVACRSSKRRKERRIDPSERAGDILSFVEEGEMKSEEEEEEWDTLLLGCAECSSLSNQFRGFRVALIAALTADYGRTPKRLLEAYRLVDSYGVLKSLLEVEYFFQQEENSSRYTNGKSNSRSPERLACVACIDAAYIAKGVLEEATSCPSSSSSFCFTAGVFDTLAREIRHFKALSPEVLHSLDSEKVATQFLERFAQFVTCQNVC